MQNVSEEHKISTHMYPPPITQESTKVSCKSVNGEWAIEVAPATPVPIGTSWRSLVGLGGNAAASIGSSEQSNAFSFRLIFVS